MEIRLNAQIFCGNSAQWTRFWLAVTKSGTGTWGLGRGTRVWDVGRVGWDVGTWGRGDVGTWGRGDVGTWGRGDVGTWGRGDVGTWDVGTWGRGEAQSKTSEMKI